MPQLYVKVRLAEVTLYNIELSIDLQEPVSSLKKMICEKDKSLRENRIIVAYCGNVLEDSRPLHTYDIIENAMVHVFIEIKPDDKMPPTKLHFREITKLLIALRSLKPNSVIRNELLKLRYPEAIGDLILSTPGLNLDVVSRTLLQHPDLLSQTGNTMEVENLVKNHPAMAAALLEIARNASNTEPIVDETHPRDRQNPVQINVNTSDEEDMDVDVSFQSTLSEDNISHAVNVITTAQLALALANVITPQPQPSTSGTSTSTRVSTARTQTRTDINLQLMRDMGLPNETINRRALEEMGNLESAVDLVLAGYTITENYHQNNE